VNPERLRAETLRALSAHADARAHDAIARGELVIVSGVSRWSGPRGPVTGHKVGLGLSAADLARIVDAHGVRDSIVAATAAAIASEEGNALAELVLFWSPAAQVETAHYRGALGSSDLAEAVVEFLSIRGEACAEAFARTARFRVKGQEVWIEPAPPADLAKPVHACLHVLLEPVDGARIAVHGRH
jgi:hypothetical protein